MSKVTAITVCLCFFFLTNCRQKEEKTQEAFKPNTGQIQVLNACGFPGAAEAMRNFLTDKGFDIVEFGNADSWNYAETIVVARTENTAIARDLARILSLDTFVLLTDSSRMVDATIYVGKDYYKRLR
ncbi:LytR C-terminal domain-containing protein [Fibrobacterota bacterium]